METVYTVLPKKPLADTMIHKNLAIQLDNGYYSNGKNDLFSAVIILRYLLSSTEFNYFISGLNGSINKLSSKLKTISINDILEIMGFPQNWKNIKSKDILVS